MKNVLDSREEIEQRIFVFPNSILEQNDVKINYAQFLVQTEIEGCVRALRVISGRIDMDKIDAIIEDTPYISDIHKTFLKTMIKERKEQIIDKAVKDKFGVTWQILHYIPTE